MRPIELLSDKKGEKILRTTTAPFVFEGKTQKEINSLVNEMRDIMREANGIGLAANQIGLDLSVFVAECPSAKGPSKFYAVFNPKIEKLSEEKDSMEEGCLSVPETFGEVERPEKITISFQDKSGKPQKLKTWGLLAKIFQHEIDHLNGKLIVDRAKKISKVSSNE